MNEMNLTNGNEPVKRSQFLTALCILTFIWSGLGSLSALLIPIVSEPIIEIFKNSPNYDETAMKDMLTMLQAGWGYYGLTLVLALGSLTGAILMWKLKKIGIHFYALSNLALLFVPTFVLGIAISWFGILITSGFIALYAVNLKQMS